MIGFSSCYSSQDRKRKSRRASPSAGAGLIPRPRPAVEMGLFAGFRSSEALSYCAVSCHEEISSASLI
jgi:hypothetical protein